MNRHKLKEFAVKNNSPICVLRCRNVPDEGKYIKNKYFRQMQQKMPICEGSRIMLRQNLSKPASLVNGSEIRRNNKKNMLV